MAKMIVRPQWATYIYVNDNNGPAHYADGFIKIGIFGNPGPLVYYQKAIVKFANTNRIPVANISQVLMHFYVNSLNSPDNLKAYQVLKPVTRDAAWRIYAPDISWDVPGCGGSGDKGSTNLVLYQGSYSGPGWSTAILDKDQYVNMRDNDRALVFELYNNGSDVNINNATAAPSLEISYTGSFASRRGIMIV
ncbi:MAG: hypothetical protein VB108_01110 [Anaerolineaceae bacterium]|nr:hypothetical protein [Anaerolineaceae bacterium]